MRLHVLPLAVAVIMFGTAVPVELRMRVPWSMTFGSWDFLANILLYLPLGLWWRRHPIVIGVLAGALLSGAIEVLQLWYFGRQGALYDVVANALGVACGVLVARWCVRARGVDLAWIRVDRRAGAIAATGVVVLLIAWAWPTRASSLMTWDERFDLQLGNESTSDRPWRGTIEALALVPQALSDADIRAASSFPNSDLRAALHGRDAYVLQAPTVLDGGAAKVLPADAARSFLRSAVARNAFTVVAIITPATVAQRGPARIVSFSRDQFNRNFDLGQDEDRLVFRVRTPVTGPNGMDPRIETPSILEAGRSMTVVATFDGSVTRVHVNGQAVGRQDLAAAGCLLPFLCGSDLPIAAWLFGALMAASALAFGRPRLRSNRLVLVVFAALTSAALLRFFAVDRSEFLYGWGAPLIALVGAATVAASWSADRSGLTKILVA